MEQPDSNRLASLDFLRGLIMVLLILESTRLYDHLLTAADGSALQPLVLQFFHHPWNGLRFWDLVQPGFMFMAGTAMAFSISRQNEQHVPWTTQLVKALRRSAWLFFWGVLDYAVRPGGLSFELWDVLTQLSFTSLVAFLIFRYSIPTQIAVSIGFLLLAEILYRFTSVPGFDQPFTDQHNFGNYVDLILMNKINPGGWVAINCLSTAAHTIWGAIAGKVLLDKTTETQKLRRLLFAGIGCLVAGYAMDWTVTPIIKRIATSSFVIASGGWCLLALTVSHYLIDLKGYRRNLMFFTVVGMNSIFIYLFIEIVASRWFNGYVTALVTGITDVMRVPELPGMILASLAIFSLEWGLCWFLFKKKIFLKV